MILLAFWPTPASRSFRRSTIGSTCHSQFEELESLSRLRKHSSPVKASQPRLEMARSLTTPRWIAAHLLALSLFILFVNLGLWQLRRLDERRLDNLVAAGRAEAPRLDLEIALAGAGVMHESLAGRHVTATGTYDVDREVLIRSQVENGQAGFHVITPLVLESDAVVLVNRGWVPLDMGSVPVLAAPPAGETSINGIVALDQARPNAPVGEAPIYNRVDLGAIGGGDLLPVYVILDEERSNRLPIPLPPPNLTSEGNHLFYSIQWFSFALIGLVGYTLLLRRARQASDDVGVGNQGEDSRVDPDLGRPRAGAHNHPGGLGDRLIDPDSESVR